MSSSLSHRCPTISATQSIRVPHRRFSPVIVQPGLRDTRRPAPTSTVAVEVTASRE